MPTLVAANGDDRRTTSPVVEAVREHGPLTGPQLREATGLAKKEVDRAVASLHHRLVLTNSHLVEQDGPWGALAHDLLARKWKLPTASAGARGRRGASWRRSCSSTPAS